jgi:hypothetical protein
MAQITSVTSESLQAKIRELLPSQQGFGEDLQASNVILPTIDLTAAAEGTQVPTYLQTALAFGSQTSFLVNNTTTTLANTPGFYRVFGVLNGWAQGAANGGGNLALTDGLAVKQLFQIFVDNGATEDLISLPFDFTVFLAAGESLTGTSDAGNNFLRVTVRQVADVNGNLVNPSGFTPQ